MRHAATKGVIFLSVLAVMSVLANQAKANLLVNGRIDTPDVTGCFTLFTSSPPGFGWTITPDGGLGVDLIDGFEAGGPCWDGIGGTTNPDGVDQSVDIDGASSISQSFATVPGQTYEVSFFYSRNPTFTSAPRTGFVTVAGNSTLVSVTLVHDVSNSNTDMNWLRFSNTFIADSSLTILTIQGDAPNGLEGFAVDNVSVIEVSVDVGGSVTGVSPTRVICKNLTTGQTVTIQDRARSWNCEAAGLVVNPRDRIRQTVRGFAD